jgi:hypothetical protein
MTLTQTAIFTKRAIILFAVMLFLGITSFVGYKMWQGYYIAHLPAKVIKPETSYGPLPPLEFPQSVVNPTTLTYSIDTATGSFPSFDNILKVYFSPKAAVTLLASDRANELANRLGIKTPATVVSDIKYSYQDGNKSLTVDLDTGNFKYTNASTFTPEAGLDLSESGLSGSFKGILSTLQANKPELSNGPAKIIFYNYDGSQLNALHSNKGANAAVVSIWPDKIDNKPIVNPDFNKSLVQGLVYGSPNNIENYGAINFTFWPIDTTVFSTYPIKTADMALDDLKSGQGTILMAPTGKASITSAYIAYFQSDTYSSYLQPIYVFEGPKFVAYVPAVTKDFVSFK